MSSKPDPRSPIPDPPNLNFGNRILILAAHPDDEVVACAAAIGRARQAGAQVFVRYLTDGCVGRNVMWPWQRHRYGDLVARRLAEADKAARFLGITALNQPSRPTRSLRADIEYVYAEIREAVAAYRIDQIWAPAYEGGHADHDVLNAIASTFARKGKALSPCGRGRKNLELRSNSLVFAGEGSIDPDPSPKSLRDFDPEPAPAKAGAREGCNLEVLEFSEYNFFGNKPHSNEFPYPNGTEQTLVLTPEEQETKRVALEIYASEKCNLGYVRTERECYRPLAAYDYSKPPHPGTLWYARHHWLPFRHPRIDFTKPEQVSAAIDRFLAAPQA